MKKNLYRTTGNLRYNHKRYEPGSEIELTEAQAASISTELEFIQELPDDPLGEIVEPGSEPDLKPDSKTASKTTSKTQSTPPPSEPKGDT